MIRSQHLDGSLGLNLSHTLHLDKRKSVHPQNPSPPPSSSQLTGSTLAENGPSHASTSTIGHESTSLNDLSRTTSATSGLTISSNLYIEPEYNVKLVLNFTPAEIQLIRSTWLEMINDDLTKNLNTSTDNTVQSTSINHSSIASSLFCIQFYSNLLSMDPHLERMFPSIKHQAVSFAGVLSTAIHSLDNLKGLDDYLQNLGKRHARILGIDPPHFELMGVALLKTFHDRFGIHFTIELERCWSRLYTYLANSILQFGIDPVLKVEKINHDWETATLGGNNHNHSSMEKPSMTDLSDTRSINTTNSGNMTQASKLRQPSSSNLSGSYSSKSSTGQPNIVAMSLLGNSSRRGQRTQKTRINSGVPLPPSAAGSEEEKCVIM